MYVGLLCTVFRSIFFLFSCYLIIVDEIVSIKELLFVLQGCFDQLASILSTACSGIKSPLKAVLDRYKSNSMKDLIRNQLADVSAKCAGQKHQVLQTGIADLSYMLLQVGLVYSGCMITVCSKERITS